MPKMSEHSKSVLKLVGGYYGLVTTAILAGRLGFALASRLPIR